MQQRDWSGDRQPPRGDRVDLGKEIMKAEQYPTMKRVMELMREGLRINIANESRASRNRSTLLPAHKVEASPSCPASPEFDATRESTTTDASFDQAAERGAVQSERLPVTHGVGVQGEARQVCGEWARPATERWS